ncbi:MAG: ParB N-terminal domain-containing protein, partial [bacterium]|nr:ParB N-terminal domain-containing protein [bacterium]
MKLPIAEIKVTQSIRFDYGSIQALAENIAEFGLLHPLVVNEHYELIAGFRRLKSVELLGWTEVPVTLILLQKNCEKFGIVVIICLNNCSATKYFSLTFFYPQFC